MFPHEVAIHSEKWFVRHLMSDIIDLLRLESQHEQRDTLQGKGERTVAAGSCKLYYSICYEISLFEFSVF